MTRSEFQNQFKVRRLALGLSQEQVAEKLFGSRLQRTKVSKIETFTNGMTDETKLRYAEILGCEIRLVPKEKVHLLD